jgi:hypothetical protein
MHRCSAVFALSAFMLALWGTAPASAQKMSQADAQRECARMYGRGQGYGGTNENIRNIVRQCVREKMGASKAKR